MIFKVMKNNLTLNDKRNKDASEHVEHKVELIKDFGLMFTRTPWTAEFKTRYFCNDCKKVFNYHETRINEEVRREYKEDQIDE